MDCNSKQSPTVSWIGFGMTLFVLLANWMFHLSLYLQAFPDSKQFLESFLYNGFIIGSSLLLVGLILCIIGLIISSKEKRDKAVAIWGIIFVALTLLTFAIDFAMSKEPVQVITPPSIEQQATDYSDCVLLSFDSYGTLQ